MTPTELAQLNELIAKGYVEVTVSAVDGQAVPRLAEKALRPEHVRDVLETAGRYLEESERSLRDGIESPEGHVSFRLRILRSSTIQIWSRGGSLSSRGSANPCDIPKTCATRARAEATLPPCNPSQ